MISIIVAYSKNRAIGREGKIPWHLPEDLKLFKSITIGHTVVMGRKTWESLPKKPLSNRQNIVMTNNIFDKDICASSTEEAINMSVFDHIFVIGGSQIYSLFLDQNKVDNILASELQEEYDGDSFFPKLDSRWERNLIKQFDKFNFVEYKKEINASKSN